jgi:DNA-binding beta-propeller fold protein YncE
VRKALAIAVTAITMVVGEPAFAASTGRAADGLRDVLIVGNNWDGTADVLDVPSYERVRRIDVAPDRAERVAEIMMNPAQAPFYYFVQTQVGEGHDQMVDDMYASKDGRTLYVSRPSFADVVAIDMATGKIIWRRPVRGVRSDHMAISPDGRRLVVSRAVASGTNGVDVIDTATGEFAGEFASGDTPHENNFSHDGSLIYHASIGRNYTPLDDPSQDATKGVRVFEIVDANSLQVLKKWNMADKLAEAGHPGMSSAVRPMALSPDEKWLYFQVSFFHGFVEFDLMNEKVTRVADLPIPPEVAKMRRDEYILDSAHHGIAMNGAGTKLCVAGTMSNYAAIVHRDDFSYKIHPLGARTYWATSSADGKYCYVSVAGDDTLAVFSYDTEQEVARVPVGDHPQRARTARVSTAIFGAPPSGRAAARKLSLRAVRRPKGIRLTGRLVLPTGVSLAQGCNGLVRLDLRRGGKVVARGAANLRARSGRCVYGRTLRVPAGKKRLTAHARFAGNGALLPRRAGRALVRGR